MFDLNLNIKNSTPLLIAVNDSQFGSLRCSLILIKNNGFLLSSFIKIKGHRKHNKSKFFVYSKLLNFLPIYCENWFLLGEKSQTKNIFSFFCSLGGLKNLYNSFYSSFLSSSKVWFDEMELVGLGYRLTIKNRSVRFRLGFSHVIILPIPSSIFLLKRKKRLLVYSTNKEKLSFFVSLLLKLKKMSAYKVKGIKKKNQIFNLKPGKKRAK